jgi:hypothetical protein
VPEAVSSDVRGCLRLPKIISGRNPWRIREGRAVILCFPKTPLGLDSDLPLVEGPDRDHTARASAGQSQAKKLRGPASGWSWACGTAFVFKRLGRVTGNLRRRHAMAVAERHLCIWGPKLVDIGLSCSLGTMDYCGAWHMATWREALRDARIPLLAVAAIWLVVGSALWLT